MENSTGKKKILKKYSDKCQRLCTVDTDIEAESASKSPKNQKIRKKGKTIITRIRFSKKTLKNFTETRNLSTNTTEARE
jgi:predicted ABC-type ATPase